MEAREMYVQECEAFDIDFRALWLLMLCPQRRCFVVVTRLLACDPSPDPRPGVYMALGFSSFFSSSPTPAGPSRNSQQPPPLGHDPPTASRRGAGIYEKHSLCTRGTIYRILPPGSHGDSAEVDTHKDSPTDERSRPGRSRSSLPKTSRTTQEHQGS